MTDLERVRQQLTQHVATAKSLGFELRRWVCIRRGATGLGDCCCILGAPLVKTGFGATQEFTLGDFVAAAAAVLGITQQQATDIMMGFDSWFLDTETWGHTEWFDLGREFGRRENCRS